MYRNLSRMYVFSVVVNSAAVAATDVRRVSDSSGAYFLFPLAATPLLLPMLKIYSRLRQH